MQPAIGGKNQTACRKDRQPGGQGFACPEFQEQRNEDNLLGQGKQHLHHVGRPSAKDATRAARSQKRHVPSYCIARTGRQCWRGARSSIPIRFSAAVDAAPKSRLLTTTLLADTRHKAILCYGGSDKRPRFTCRNFIGSKHCREARFELQKGAKIAATQSNFRLLRCADT